MIENGNRLVFIAVFLINMMCAVQFIVDPQSYTYSYEVATASGGIAAIQGIGVAFAMWNVTYPFYIWKPSKMKWVGIIILIQQLVGLVGELYIKSTLGMEQVILASSIMRFVYFDLGGFICMLVAFVCMMKGRVFED